MSQIAAVEVLSNLTKKDDGQSLADYASNSFLESMSANVSRVLGVG